MVARTLPCETCGCKHCYAERINMRLGTGLDYSVKSLHEINIEIHEETLAKPLRWTRPRMIFVSSMSDLFHEIISFEMIDKVFAVMALCPQHTFMVLTKRPARMREYFGDDYSEKFTNAVNLATDKYIRRLETALHFQDEVESWLPLKNVWLGVTCENQETADERIPLLLQTPAAVRWLSCEPLLGKIDLELGRLRCIECGVIQNADHTTCLVCKHWHNAEEYIRAVRKIDWCVVGGESGRKDQDIRPMHPKWARSLRDQCVSAGVPFFFKQNGEWLSGLKAPYDRERGSSQFRLGAYHDFGDDYMALRVGKKAAGRLLDNREWNEFTKV